MALLHASSGRLDTFPITVHAGLACLQRALAVLDCHSGAFESSIVVGDSSSTCLSVHMALQHAPSGCASVLLVARVTGLAGEPRVLHGFAELLSLCAHLQPAHFTVTALQVAVLPLPIHVVVGNGTFLALTTAAHLGIVSLCLLPDSTPAQACSIRRSQPDSNAVAGPDGARSMSCASALPRKRRIRLVQGSIPWRVETHRQRGAAQRLRSSQSAQCDAFA